MNKNDLIEKVTTTLDKALAADDDARDSLTRVAMGYAQLLNFVIE